MSFKNLYSDSFLDERMTLLERLFIDQLAIFTQRILTWVQPELSSIGPIDTSAGQTRDSEFSQSVFEIHLKNDSLLSR